MSTVEVGDIGKTLWESFSVRGRKESGGELFKGRERDQSRLYSTVDITLMNASPVAASPLCSSPHLSLRFGNLINESPIAIVYS